MRAKLLIFTRRNLKLLFYIDIFNWLKNEQFMTTKRFCGVQRDFQGLSTKLSTANVGKLVHQI